MRRLIHAMGYRFRLHAVDLPGKPDIVFRRRKKAIFVHGCFWHRHPGCKYSSLPKSHVDFWQDKFSKNVARDRRNLDALAVMGWNVLTIWTCELKEVDALLEKIQSFLDCDTLNQC